MKHICTSFLDLTERTLSLPPLTDPIEKQEFVSASDSPNSQNANSVSEQVEKQEADDDNGFSTHTGTTINKKPVEECRNEDLITESSERKGHVDGIIDAIEGGF